MSEQGGLGEQDVRRVPRYRNKDSEKLGEFVTTEFMIHKLKQIPLEELESVTISDVIEKMNTINRDEGRDANGDLKNKNHRQRAGLALTVAKYHHPENK